jgi:pimeloyl-ACP methyl ester carboxylesterase
MLAALAAVAAVAGLTLLGGCASFDVSLRRLALRPTPGVPAAFAPGSPGEREHFGPGDQRFTVAVPGSGGRPEQLALWWLPQADPAAPALLYLHGTFRNLYQNLPKIEALRQAGFAIVAVDYRGWGESTPIVPSEATIAADARRAWEEVQRRQPDAARRVIFGHSMGGSAAVTLGSGLHGGVDYGALVLESTFTRMSDIGAAAGFWGSVLGALSTLEFDSLSRIGRIDAPVWILHGSADQVVPVALGRRLWQAAPAGANWVEVPGGSHSRLHSEAAELYQQTMKNLIEQLSRPHPVPPAAAPAPRAMQP